jgi:hypothetical protein
MQSLVKAGENTVASTKVNMEVSEKVNTEENMVVSERVNIIDKSQICMNMSG